MVDGVTRLLDKIRTIIRKHQLLEEGQRVIVGFSGGVDSLCLLHALRSLTELRLDLWAVYINHSLRPAENIREEELLREVGDRWQVRTQTVILDLPARLREKPQSLQLLAREERYRIFRELAAEVGAAKVALGHHLDDQVETVLYRLIRGTGPDGLAGIPVSRDGLFIRPLLGVFRSEILEYAAGHGLAWVEDSSNRKVIYRRNRLRQELIPQLETVYNPGFKQAVVRLADLAAEQRSFMDQVVSETLAAGLGRTEGRVSFPLARWRQCHPYLQYSLLKGLLRRLEPDRPVEQTPLLRLRERLIREGTAFHRTDLLKGVAVLVEEETIVFERSAVPLPVDRRRFPVAVPGRTLLPGGEQELSVATAPIPDTWEHFHKNVILVDPAKLRLPLAVRFRRPGDSFRPFGAAGTQKLHDFFINLKVPRPRRDRIPLLVTADDRIIWVIGYRPSDDFKLDETSAAGWRVAVGPPATV
jgi:tRNA(Ile)-lysidine synthase